ncbi:NmrA family NAD(P)-binding protein [Pleomorphomonas sp. PLEO]|uniref:NmrA family NAD(P)-binding protein n=1 Tax=Pleomorphomonas sp. PLEO TaxID=3239306 RepID=UPI00351DC8B7
MRIAVVGATGRIGAKLTRTLLDAGHQVKALSRGGPALDALVNSGAEPFLGSFDTGAGDLDKFFQDADAAFLMVKTDWSNIHGHYSAVGQRFVDALVHSPVRLAVSLTAIGSEVAGSTGHFESFYKLDQKLNQLSQIDLVHLRAGWFMENTLAWTGAVAKHGRIGWSLDPNLKTPWVATQDIADLAAKELTHPTGERRVVREVGSQDLTMPEVAAIIGREIGRPVAYRFVDRTRPEIEAEYLKRFGTPETWLDDSQTLAALNDGRVRFHGSRGPLPTTMEVFIRDVWKPRYLKSLADDQEAETFYTWSARD